jgi:hypothetical protein
MKFSIRDLLLMTVIVALALAWWLDRSWLASEIRDYEIIEMPNKRGEPGTGMPLKEWRQEQMEWAEGEKKRAREWNKMTKAQREQENRRLFGDLPNSSAPAPNPPKK